MKSIKILTVIFCIIFLNVSTYAELLQVINDGLLYTINTDNGRAFCDGPLERNGENGNDIFTIKDQFYYNSTCYQVTGVSREAFKGINCYNIYFPKNLKNIDIGAFEECTGIKGDIAFNEISISASAFKSCSGITTLKLGGKSSIGGNAFENCDNLSALILEEGVESIGCSAFENCKKISEVSLKNGITRIDDRAFAGTNIHSITIPSTVEYLGNEIFEDTGLEEVIYCAIECKGPSNMDLSVFPESIRVLTISNDVKFIPNLFHHCNRLQKIIYNAFSAVFTNYSPIFPPNVEEVMIGDSVNRIPGYFLKDNKSLKEIKINNSVRTIGYNAFENCVSLEDVEIARYSVSTIEPEAFKCCTSLKSIKLPYSLTNLGNGAFMNCVSLENVDFGIGSFSTINHHTFENCINLKTLDFSKTPIKYFETAAFRGCQKLNSIVWSESSREYRKGYIEDRAFENCVSLKDVGYADKSTSYIGIKSYIDVSSIGEYSFSGCDSLNNISIHADRIYEGAFKDCIGLTNLHIPYASFEGDYIFDGCPIERIAFGDLMGRYRPFETKSTIKSLKTGTHAIRKGEFPKLNFEKIVFNNYNSSYYLNGYELPIGSGIREPFAADSLVQVGLVYYIDDQGYPCEDINPFGIGQFKSIVVSPDFNFGDSTIPENAYVGSSSEYASIENISIVKKKAFYNSGLKHLSIEHIDSICNQAFSNNAIEHIFIDGQLPNFDSNAFDQHSYDNTIVYYINHNDNNDIGEKSEWRMFKHLYKLPQFNGVINNIRHETELGNKVDLDSIMAQDINLKGIPDLKYRYYDSEAEVTYEITDNIFDCNSVGSHSIIVDCLLPCKVYDRIDGASSFANIFTAGIDIVVKDLPQTKLIDHIDIYPSKLILKKSKCVRLTTKILPEDADVQTLIWSSSDESVAKVDNIGLVTATGIGECVITAAAVDGSNVSATCTITVEPLLVESLAISPEIFSGSKGDSVTIVSTILPEDADNKSLTWASSDESIATVDETGQVTAIGIGKCIITASAADGSGVYATCAVSVTPRLVKSILLYPHEWTGHKGDSFYIEVSVAPENADNKRIKWLITDSGGNIIDEKRVSIDETGLVTVNDTGHYWIMAVATDGSDANDTCFATVEPRLVESLKISPEEFMGKAGDSFRIETTVLPEDAANKTLNFSSSNENVATVNYAGNVTLYNEGIAVIKVTTTDGSNIEALCVIASTSGIEELFTDEACRYDVYSVTGMLLRKDADKEYVARLSEGIYILINGNKVVKLNLTGK